MFESAKDALSYIRNEKITQVDLKIVGLTGEWLHIALPAREFTMKFFEEGVGYDGSSVGGFSTLESGDLAAMPDPTAAFTDPFYDRPTLSFLCNTVTADTKEPYARDPRAIARRAEQYLKDSGIADRAVFGPEFEFNIFDRIHMSSDPYNSGVTIVADSAVDEGRSYPIPPQRGYLRCPPLDQTHNLRTEIVEELERLGVPIHYHHHEVGAAGQCEIEVAMDTLTQIADRTMLIKYVVKNVARRMDKIATFMPKPLYGEAGNGMHVHQKLDRGGKPLFFDEQGPYANLSTPALNYIAGLLAHGRALTGLTNPSTNSFKRLVPGHEAPVNLFFSLANRSAAIRIPKYAIKPEDKRLEYRPPDFTGNIYLTLAAMLLAGIDGIKQRLDPQEHNFGPFDIDVSKADPELRARITPIPTNIDNAMAALAEDHGFLTAGEVFPPDLIDVWIDMKLNKEVSQILSRPHPYEFNLYLDV